jgi:hypothetical protein
LQSLILQYKQKQLTFIYPHLNQVY